MSSLEGRRERRNKLPHISPYKGTDPRGSTLCFPPQGIQALLHTRLGRIHWSQNGGVCRILVWRGVWRVERAFSEAFSVTDLFGDSSLGSASSLQSVQAPGNEMKPRWVVLGVPALW